MNTPSTSIWSSLNPDNSTTPEEIPICRGVYDLAQPWAPSPLTESAASIQVDPLSPPNSRHPGTSISIEGQSSDAKSRKVVWKRLKRLLGSSVPSPGQTHPAVRRRVVPTPGDWRAYGYWACPRVNNVNVNNRSSIPISTAGVNIEAIFHSLIGPDGSPHPERWLPGLAHPALPPRPSLWEEAVPLASISEYILNPFLHHRVVGYSPIYFRIDNAPMAVYHRKPLARNLMVPLWIEELAQPATYPFLTTMHITSVADDDGPFPWHMTVQNPAGILLRDVLATITQTFNQYIAEEEFLRWSPERQTTTKRAYRDRVAMPTLSLDPFVVPVRDDTGMRRVDYMGERVLFRGLEASDDGTWIMFLGPM